MIKTLRITTIIAAGLALVFLILPMFFGGRTNKAIEQFLNSSGVVEKYNMGAEYNAKLSQDHVSPLVTQAEIFVQYLNPPPPPEPVVEEAPKPVFSRPKPITVTAKFSLIGTSVRVAQPEMSLAFINEPGKGSRWVRQGSQVEHLTIKEVKDGLIVLQDGQRTFEIATQEKPQVSLVENAPSVSSEVIGGTSSRPDVTASQEPDAVAAISTPALPQIDQNALEKFMESLQAEAESGEIDSQNVDKFLSTLGSMRISDDEAEKLQRLPKEQLSPEPAPKEDLSQQPISAEDEGLSEPEQNAQQSTAQETHVAGRPVDYKERLSALRSRAATKDETAEPNQVTSPKVRRPVRLPPRSRRSR